MLSPPRLRPIACGSPYGRVALEHKQRLASGLDREFAEPVAGKPGDMNIRVPLPKVWSG